MNMISQPRRLVFQRVAILGFVGVLLLSCVTKPPENQRPVKIVSWGGQFQEDMRANWWATASEKCGIAFEPGSWDGSYGTLSSRIKREINDWDLIHVEAHYVKTPEAASLFESFADRKLPRVDPQLVSETAVPILEYGYVLTYRSDLGKIPNFVDWATFFDLQTVPGHRGLRDFPLGNIEIALLSKGHDLKTVLYDSELSKGQIELRVDEALDQLERIKPSIIWWTSGDQLQRILTSGEAPMTAAWSGRVLSAYRQLCPGVKDLKNCSLQSNESTSLISTDWWIIPKKALNAQRANEFLKCMYSNEEAIKGAQKFQELQGYSLPFLDLKVADPVASYFLSLGSSANTKTRGRIQEEFWGKNFEWIDARWRNWRTR